MIIYETEDKKYSKIERPEYTPSSIEEKAREDEKAKKWRVPISGSIWSSATVVDNVVYFGACDKHMYAVSAKDGQLVWKYKTGGPIISSPVVIGNAVYFTGNDGYFYALSRDGELLWRFRVGSEGESFSSPAVINGKIYFGTYDGHIYCLNIDGREEWRFKTGDRVVGSPAVVNDIIFVPSYDSNFYALSTDGRLRWKFPMGNSSGCSAAIIDNKYNEIWRFRKFNNHDPGKISVSHGRAVFGSWDNHVYALDIDDGRKIWDYISGGLVVSSPTVVDKKIYLGSFDGHLHCIDIEYGNMMWKLRTGGQIYSSPVFCNGMIYFGSYDQNVYALSLTGESSWNFLTGGRIQSSPTIENNVLHVGSFDTYLYAIDMLTKKVLWTFQTGMPPAETKGQVDLITDATSHRFTHWKPETIKPKNAYEAKSETTGPTFSEQPYQASHPYESRIGETYGDQKKKKRAPF